MSKTPFKMPPRSEPATAKVDEWVTGREVAATPESVSKTDRPQGKVARLTIDLTPELHAKFKATCALKGTRMIDEVRQFIEGWTQRNG